jgi:CheY-like chemotaxis protein
MLSDLLDLSSMDAGHLSMERNQESVEALLSATVENLHQSATAGSVQLDIVPHEPHMVAFCDRERILQVLINLVGNAIKFSSHGGRVRIEAKRTLDEIEFAVRDSGTGIARSQLAHIFDPYWQAPKTAKLGTGLGLSIAKGIVEFHGGRIWAESDVGRGSCFFFTLPAAPTGGPTAGVNTLLARDSRGGRLSGTQPIENPPVEVSPLPPTRGPILVVDDDLDVRVLLADLLRGEGYDVATASDGAEALDYLRAATTLPCLILLDLVMPNVDGWQFIEDRRNDPRLAPIPVVLISGHVAARETARSLGLASYVEKPFGVASLREMLARVLDGTPAVVADYRQ